MSPRIGGQVTKNKPNVSQYLTKEQAKHVYKKTESGDIINTETLHQEIEQERQLNRKDAKTSACLSYDFHIATGLITSVPVKVCKILDDFVFILGC